MDPRIGCCIDVGHTVRAGTDVVQAIHEVGPRLFNMHMKDLTDFQPKKAKSLSAMARCPSAASSRRLSSRTTRDLSTSNTRVHADDPMPGVSKSFAYMRGVLAGMGLGDKA